MEKTKKILSFFLVALFMSYYASTTFFFHSHDCKNGIVTHSHPYTSATHTHSANALQLIESLTTTFFVLGGVVFAIMLFLISREFLYSFYKQHTLNSLIGSNPLRAPPVLV